MQIPHQQIVSNPAIKTTHLIHPCRKILLGLLLLRLTPTLQKDLVPIQSMNCHPRLLLSINLMLTSIQS